MPELYEIAFAELDTATTITPTTETIVLTSPEVKLPFQTHHVVIYSLMVVGGGASYFYYVTRIRRGTSTTDPQVGDTVAQHALALGTDYVRGSVTIDPPLIAGGAAANVDVTVPNLGTTHQVFVTPAADLEAGLVPVAAYVPAANTLRVRLYNPTAAAIDGAPLTWSYFAFVPGLSREPYITMVTDFVEGLASVRYSLSISSGTGSGSITVYNALMIVKVL